MTTTKQIIPENIKLFHIENVSTYINDNTIIEDLDFDFTLAHNTKHNLADERVKIELFLNLLANEEIGIKFHLDFHYYISDLNNHYEVNETQIPIFSGEFIATLLSISYSTARGIIFQQLQETKFSKLILPVISPTKMLRDSNK